MSVVVDASVAAKWLVPESESDLALALLAQWRDGRVNGLAPDILPAEVANALWKRVNRRLMPSDVAEHLFAAFSRLEFPLRPMDDLVSAALEMALRHRHPVYDCLYVALALETHSEFVTADVRLARDLRSAHFPVRLLRDWRP